MCQYPGKKIHALEGLTAYKTACQAASDTFMSILTERNFLLMILRRYHPCLLFAAKIAGFSSNSPASLTSPGYQRVEKRT